MDALTRAGEQVQYLIDAAGGTVRARRVGRAGAQACSWVVDLGAACVTVRGRSAPVRLSDLTVVRPTPAQVQWVGAVRGAAVALGIEVQGDDLLFSVTPLTTGRAQVEEATWPGELRCRGGARELCWSDAAQGARFRADGERWRGEVNWDHAAMRVFGLGGDRESVAVIVETPHDARARFEDDGAGELRARVEFGASLGSLAYARRLRLVSLERPGHVAVADAFRSWAHRARAVGGGGRVGGAGVGYGAGGVKSSSSTVQPTPGAATAATYSGQGRSVTRWCTGASAGGGAVRPTPSALACAS